MSCLKAAEVNGEFIEPDRARCTQDRTDLVQWCRGMCQLRVGTCFGEVQCDPWTLMSGRGKHAECSEVLCLAQTSAALLQSSSVWVHFSCLACSSTVMCTNYTPTPLHYRRIRSEEFWLFDTDVYPWTVISATPQTSQSWIPSCLRRRDA